MFHFWRMEHLIIDWGSCRPATRIFSHQVMNYDRMTLHLGKYIKENWTEDEQV